MRFSDGISGVTNDVLDLASSGWPGILLLVLMVALMVSGAILLVRGDWRGWACLGSIAVVVGWWFMLHATDATAGGPGVYFGSLLVIGAGCTLASIAFAQGPRRG